jgi:hypothetical protein
MNATNIPPANPKRYLNGFKMLLFLVTVGQKVCGKLSNNSHENNYISVKIFSCSLRINAIRKHHSLTFLESTAVETHG